MPSAATSRKKPGTSSKGASKVVDKGTIRASDKDTQVIRALDTDTVHRICTSQVLVFKNLYLFFFLTESTTLVEYLE